MRYAVSRRLSTIPTTCPALEIPPLSTTRKDEEERLTVACPSPARVTPSCRHSNHERLVGVVERQPIDWRRWGCSVATFGSAKRVSLGSAARHAYWEACALTGAAKKQTAREPGLPGPRTTVRAPARRATENAVASGDSREFEARSSPDGDPRCCWDPEEGFRRRRGERRSGCQNGRCCSSGPRAGRSAAAGAGAVRASRSRPLWVRCQTTTPIPQFRA